MNARGVAQTGKADGPSLKSRAIRLLARREHTRAELARKLSPHGTADEIDSVLTELEHNGLVSDHRYAESWLRSHAARFGTARLRQTLATRGVTATLIDAEVAALPDEAERARAVWVRKFGTPPADAREWAKQARFLQARGFAPDLIRRLLRQPAP